MLNPIFRRFAMDPVLSISTAFALFTVIALVLLQRRRYRIRQVGELALLPARIVNPRLYAKFKTIRAWQLEVKNPVQACTWAREARGSRFQSDLAVPVPISGCGRQCKCEYQPIVETRKRQRRTDPIDRLHMNLGEVTAANRRRNRGRRKSDKWKGDNR